MIILFIKPTAIDCDFNQNSQSFPVNLKTVLLRKYLKKVNKIFKKVKEKL